MLKTNRKGKIIKGKYSPKGEVMIKDNGEGGGYYIYIWPNDGTKWTDSDVDMIYDYWLENLERLKSQLKYFNWKIEWEDGEEGDFRQKKE